MEADQDTSHSQITCLQAQTSPYLLLFSRLVASDSLWLYGLQHTRLLCPSLSLGVCSNLRSLSRGYHPTISSSVTLFSSCPQSSPASGSFPMGRLFATGGQSIGGSASAAVLLMNIQDWFPLGLTGLISLLSKGLSRVFSNTTVQKASILQHSACFIVQLSHLYMTTGITIALTIQTCQQSDLCFLIHCLGWS